MISLTKVLFFSLYCSMLTVVVDGERQSINSNGGGQGGGSNGRGNTKAVNSSSSTRPSGSSSSTVNIASPTPNTPSITSPTPITPSPQDNQNLAIEFNSGNDNNNSASSSNNNDSNNSGGMSNFGTTGTLADRERDVSCPICMAVADRSYDENHQVDVGSGVWTCGYIQETVQDVNMDSRWETERNNCRNAQRIAEEGGCCAETMFINQPGEDFNDPCDLCGSGSVAADKLDVLVDTRVVGSHTCSGLDFVMKERIFTSTICDAVKANIANTCCRSGTATGRTASLRGGISGGSVP